MFRSPSQVIATLFSPIYCQLHDHSSTRVIHSFSWLDVYFTHHSSILACSFLFSFRYSLSVYVLSVLLDFSSGLTSSWSGIMRCDRNSLFFAPVSFLQSLSWCCFLSSCFRLTFVESSFSQFNDECLKLCYITNTSPEDVISVALCLYGFLKQVHNNISLGIWVILYEIFPSTAWPPVLTEENNLKTYKSEKTLRFCIWFKCSSLNDDLLPGKFDVHPYYYNFDIARSK